jgi:CTP:phosphocholine cytidylyltransferase-like protein
MEPERLMDDISKELSNSLKMLAKAKTVEEKLQYSEVVKNLSESLGVFLNAIADMAPYDFDDLEE